MKEKKQKTKITFFNTLILIMFIQVFSCNESGTPIVTQYNARAIPGSVPLFSESDTLIAGNDTINFICTLDLQTKSRKWNNAFRDDSITHKDDSGYLFKLGNGEELRLRNNYERSEGLASTDYRVYSDFWNMEVLNHWLFEVAYYDVNTFEIIDKTNGEIIEMADFPIVSPNNDKIIVAHQDNDNGVEYNGIEFLRIKNNRIEKMWMRDLTTIGLSNPRWLDKDTVLFSRQNIQTRKKDFVKACFK